MTWKTHEKAGNPLRTGCSYLTESILRHRPEWNSEGKKKINFKKGKQTNNLVDFVVSSSPDSSDTLVGACSRTQLLLASVKGLDSPSLMEPTHLNWLAICPTLFAVTVSSMLRFAKIPAEGMMILCMEQNSIKKKIVLLFLWCEKEHGHLETVSG